MSVAAQSAVINFSASGDNTVIASPASGPVRVYGIMFAASGASNIIFKSGSTALSGAIPLTAAGSSITLPLSDTPWFTALPGSAFVVNSSNAVTVTGTIWYG